MVESFFDKEVDRLVIRVKGRFDYSCHKVFKEAFTSSEVASSYEVDLAEVIYLDSSALGMLLLLRDYADGNKTEICLTNVNKVVVDILKIANFHRLFDIVE